MKTQNRKIEYGNQRNKRNELRAQPNQFYGSAPQVNQPKTLLKQNGKREQTTNYQHSQCSNPLSTVYN